MEDNNNVIDSTVTEEKTVEIKPEDVNPSGSNGTSGGNNNNGDVPGKGKATAALVLGIIATVCYFFGVSAIISVICGIIGLVMASKSKQEGFEGGMRTAGFVMSLLGVILGGCIFIGCLACGSCLAIGSTYGAFEGLFDSLKYF